MKKEPTPTGGSELLHRREDRTNWEGLTTNDQVIVTEPTFRPYIANVDMMSYDKTVVWVISTSGAGRKAFHYADDVTIERLRPGQQPPHMPDKELMPPSRA